MRSQGYGFVQTAEGEFFVPASKMNGAFDGDVVELAPLPTQGKGRERAARVVRVVDRTHSTLIGRYEVADPFGVVVPADQRIPYDIFTMRSDRSDIEDGSLVRVRIDTYPSRHTAATGTVEEVIGRAGEDVGVELIIARHKLETAFSEATLEQVNAATLDEQGALASGYRDLRNRFTFTIDPASARDFDDALSLDIVDMARKSEESSKVVSSSKRLWRLGVHIADVAHYVEWNSSLDLDARRRATSVYLVDRVIPMLPEKLSGDLCSLMPGKVRRTMTVDLFLDDAGTLMDYQIYPALIRSDARLNYDEAQDILSSDAPGNRTLDDVADETSRALDPLSWRLATLSKLAKLRVEKRTALGGLDFDTTEAKVRLDADGHPIAIDLRRKTDATSVVEEAMILANETVAQHLFERTFPSLYRVHESPSADNLEALVPVFQEFVWFADIDAARLVAGDPHALQQVLLASTGRAEGELVSSLLLRSMKRAVYRSENSGHYGLGSKAYTHFTSPIRRYPDLVVHRMLKAQLNRRPQKFDQEVAALPWIAEHSSDMERVADAAARESQELKIIEYLQRDVGRSFSGVVSGVAAYGLYVRLENTAEGFLPVRALGTEYYAFDPARYTLTGQDSGVSYRLGQRIPVVLIAADPQTQTLDFKLATGDTR